jgi:hypothetical protein
MNRPPQHPGLTSVKVTTHQTLFNFGGRALHDRSPLVDLLTYKKPTVRTGTGIHLSRRK